MKKYDRDKKKWVNASDVERKVKKRELCKGQREHDFILCLPRHVQGVNSILGLDIAKQYYEIEDERKRMDEALDQKLVDLGIKQRYQKWRFDRHRDYICTVCQKREFRKET